MSQSIRDLEIIFDGLPHIIAPLVFSSAFLLSHCFKQALRNLYALPAHKSEFSLLFHFELNLICPMEIIPVVEKRLRRSLITAKQWRLHPKHIKKQSCLLELGNYCPKSTEHSSMIDIPFQIVALVLSPCDAEISPCFKTQPSASIEMGVYSSSNRWKCQCLSRPKIKTPSIMSMRFPNALVRWPRNISWKLRGLIKCAYAVYMSPPNEN